MAALSDDIYDAAVEGFDLRHLPEDFHSDPFPYYHALRRKAPVHRCPDGSYFLTRYDDLVAVYRDPKRFSSDKSVEFRPVFGDSSLYEHHTMSLVFNDPPYHPRVRKLLAPAFTPRAVMALQPRVERLVDDLLDRAEDKGSIDLIADLASALPVQLIGDMLGIPNEEREPLRDWSLAILGALEPTLTPEQFQTGCRAVDDFKAYLRRHIAARGRRPQTDDSGEILTKLVQETVDGQPLSELELLHNCIFLLNAGHETTTNLIGNGIEALFRFPDQMAELKANPELMATAVEEFLRFESSNQLGNRKVTVKTDVAGQQLEAGSYLHLCIGAANRDPDQFPDPDQLDLRRQPNRHLAFATGVHMCAGAPLARMEAQTAIGKVLQRFPNIHPNGPSERGGRARFRGFLKLPVALT